MLTKYYTVDYYMPEGSSWKSVGIHHPTYNEAIDYINNQTQDVFHPDTAFRIKAHEVFTLLPYKASDHRNYAVLELFNSRPVHWFTSWNTFHNDLEGAKRYIASCRDGDPHQKFCIYDTYNEKVVEEENV